MLKEHCKVRQLNNECNKFTDLIFYFIDINFSISQYFISMFCTDVETNLPPDLKEESVLCFEAAVANRMNIGDAIKKVEEDVLSKCNEEFKGKRFKGFIKFNYDTNMIAIQVF